MNFKFNTRNTARLLLQAFLGVTFFVYYQTRFVPGTLHAWLLLVGLLFTLPSLVKTFQSSGARLPLDYTAIIVFGLIIILSSLANSSAVVAASVQAYLLTIPCYVFVRENMSTVSLTFLTSLMKWFLVCNGTFAILQFVTGEFFPARYLAAGDPPLLMPSGVSDGPTKNGMLIAFALSFVFAKFLWGRGRVSYLDMIVFIVGVISLVLSVSRAGILSFCVVALVGAIFAACMRKRFRVNRRSAAIVLVILLMPLILLGAFGLEALVGLRDSDIESQYGVNVILYKFTATEDAGFDARLETVANVRELILGSPWNLLSVGFGVGAYATLHEGFNVHNSYIATLFETGLYGSLALLFLFVHVIRKALARPDVVEMLPVLAALGSVMVFMLFHDVMLGRTFWVPLAILASFAYAKGVPRESVRERSSVARLHSPSPDLI